MALYSGTKTALLTAAFCIVLLLVLIGLAVANS